MTDFLCSEEVSLVFAISRYQRDIYGSKLVPVLVKRATPRRGRQLGDRSILGKAPLLYWPCQFSYSAHMVGCDIQELKPVKAIYSNPQLHIQLLAIIKEEGEQKPLEAVCKLMFSV